jgi:hypothetical protein
MPMNRVVATSAFLAFLAFAPGRIFAQPACVPAPTVLCLNDNRFQVEVTWAHPGAGSGSGHAVPLTADTGLFWFFQPSNLELVVKVLDGRLSNRHFWVFYGGLSDVAYVITVTDLRTGVRETYHNPRGVLASSADTRAFNPEPPPAASAPKPAALAGASGSLLRQGPELQVNVTTPFMQRGPDVAAGPGGGYMVVWESDWPTGPDNYLDVYGRLYDSAGNPRTGELRLNDTTAGGQYGVHIAASSTGEFMAVWNDELRATARLFGSDGQPLGGEIPISSRPYPQSSPDVTTDPSGGFLVVWRDSGNLALGLADTVRAQRFDVRGGRVGNEIEVGSGGSSVRVASSPTGDFLVTWIAAAGSLDFESDVWARRLASSGQPLGPAVLVNEQGGQRLDGYNSTPTPVLHSDGGFSVVWTTEVFYGHGGTQGLFARRYGPDGTPAAIVPLGGITAASLGFSTAAATLPSGETLLIWTEYDRPDDLNAGLLGRLFDSSWQPLGDEIRVNSYTPDLQTEPAVAVDSSGGIVAVWSSGVEYSPVIPLPGHGEGTQDGSFFGVFSQRFTVSGCASGPDQLCLGGRFKVEVRFTSPWTGRPEAGHAVPLTGDTGGFWFFDDANVELVIKTLDGRARNGHFWVFAGALSDVEYDITVTDTVTGRVKTYHNAAHQLASRADTKAFPG